MIEGSMQAVEKGTQIANSTAEQLSQVVSGAQEIVNTIDDIATASQRQSDSIRQVTTSSAKEPSMDVVSNLADESGAPAVSCQHGQDIAWSASRVLFQDRVALGAGSRRCKIYQKLAEGNNVIFLLIFHSNQTPPVYISFIISL